MFCRRRFLSRRRTTLTVSKFGDTNARTGKSPWFCKRERNIWEEKRGGFRETRTARNHLIPQKLAKYATEENVEKALRRERRERRIGGGRGRADEDEEEKVRMFRFII